MTESDSSKKEACVWATTKERWDSFLNDPELLRAIDSVRQATTLDNSTESAIPEPLVSAADEDESAHSIGARLRAYETPITDEILRQSIR